MTRSSARIDLNDRPLPIPYIELPARDISYMTKKALKGEMRDFQIKDIGTYKIIPFFGEFYYWWFGQGKTYKIKDKRKRK